MVRKKYSDKEEIIALREKNEELRRQLAISPTKGIETLSVREKRVYQYIEEHPGTSKQKVIEKLTGEGIGSRMTILKAIKNLEEYSAIKRAPKEKPNTWVYELYVNQDSTFWSVYRELDNFKKVFFESIEKITKNNLQDQGGSEGNGDLLYHLLLICHHVLGAYLTYYLLRWQKEIHDTLILNKLHTVVIYTMVEIQRELSRAFKVSEIMPDFSNATNGEADSPILRELIQHMFLLQPEMIVRILKDFRRHNLYHEIIPVLESAWKIGFDIYPYLELDAPLYHGFGITVWGDDIDILKNLGFAIADYSRRRNIKVDDEIWRMLGPPPKIG